MPTGTAIALYTVIDVHDEEQDVVFVDKHLNDLRDRLELSSTDNFTGLINAQVTAVGLTDAEAEVSSEFIVYRQYRKIYGRASRTCWPEAFIRVCF